MYTCHLDTDGVLIDCDPSSDGVGIVNRTRLLRSVNDKGGVAVTDMDGGVDADHSHYVCALGS